MSAAPERLKKLPVSRAFGKFTDRTGMHAVSTIAQEKTVFRRCAWACLLLISLVMLGIQVHGISRKFVSRPSTTKVELITESNATFPVVSFCNLNAVKRSMLDYITGKEGKEKFLDIFKRLGHRYYLHHQLVKLKDISNNSFWRPPHIPHVTITHLAKVLEDNYTERFMYSLREMLLECKFENKHCESESNFTPFFSPRFGMCFAFDFENFFRKMPSRVKFRKDLTSIFELTLNADASSYIPELAPAVGYLIMFNARVKPPMPEEEGFIAAPGFLTQFGLKKTELRRLPPPYGKCDTFISRNERANMYFKTFNNTKPTQDVCLRTCEQIEIMKKCKCYSAYHGNTDADAFAEFQQARNNLCLINDEWLCQDDLIEEIRNGESKHCNEMCPSPECNTTLFQVSQTAGVWPDDYTLKMLRKGHQVYRALPVMSTSVFQRNVLRVRIKFEDLNVIVYKTQVAYDWLDLLSDLGGQGGLWLGISVFTVFEVWVMIGELVILIFRNIVLRCRRNKQNANGEAKEKDTECQNECSVENEGSVQMQNMTSDI